MPPKTIDGSYPGGYALNAAYATLDIGSSASIGGTGLTTTASNPSTISNEGSIAGSGAGATLGDGGAFANLGTIRGAVLENSGGYPFSDPELTDTGRVTIVNGSGADASALLSGGGVAITGGAGVVLNYGTVETQPNVGGYHDESYPAGFGLDDGGSVTNRTTGRIESGVVISGGRGTIVNLGVIYSVGEYVPFFGQDGADLKSGGDITNGSATDSSASLSGRLGVRLAGAGVITNFGTVASAGPALDAVDLTSASEVFVEEGTGVILGRIAAVDDDILRLAAGAGAGTISGLGHTITGFSTIEVMAGAGWHLTGANTIVSGQILRTAAGISESGGKLINDGVIEAGAIVVLSDDGVFANETLGRLLLQGNVGVSPQIGAAGTSIVNAGLIEKQSGTGVSVLRGAIANNGDIYAATGTTELTGAVTGSGEMRIAAGASLELAGAVGPGQAVRIEGANGVLELADAEAFAAGVHGFGAGETIDVHGFNTATVIGYSGGKTKGVLALADGGKTASIDLFGQFTSSSFHAAADGHGGLAITFVAAPDTAHTLATPSR